MSKDKRTQGKVKHGSGLPMTGGTACVQAPFGSRWPFTAIMAGYETIALLPAQDKNKIHGHDPVMDISVMNANASHIEATWNASCEMSTDEAVRHLEHGKQALEMLKKHCSLCMLGHDDSEQTPPCKDGETCGTGDIIKSLEG